MAEIISSVTSLVTAAIGWVNSFVGAITGQPLLLLFVITKGRRFDGENTCFYFLWYGLGRTWVESLRTDSLYLFGWTFMGSPIRVSQALSIVMVLVSACALLVNLRFRHHDPAELLVNQVAAAAAESAEEEEYPAPAAEQEETDNGSEN